MASELVTWRGTPGVGDFMWALNSAHRYAADENVSKINLELHWEHDEDYLHHFEDPETIIERCNYIHNFYHDKDRVQVHHCFNAQGRYLDWKFNDDVVTEHDGSKRIAAKRHNKNRFWFQSGYYTDKPGDRAPNNDWIFREDAFKPTKKERIVFWRPTWNAEQPRTWKRQFENQDWERLISFLSDKGFEMCEIGYRTPVREAMYLISTARLVICYDGIWHYVAKNFARPMAVISGEGVTKYHTPNALRINPSVDYNEQNPWWWLDNLGDLLGHAKDKAVDYELRMSYFYGND